ncbi:MAG: threonine--tRNA ligase [Candidatus Nomurabacteria bacterium]|jgi:threonyl-tRNA synthetase|nr:threonine--tRNA ligase [Candidatus Nomurabacteria bacterium]
MNEEQLSNVRHSLAHVLAAAVRRIYGADKVKLGVGPVVNDGFYYDFDLGNIKISEDDLPKIEKEMSKIIVEKQEFVGEEKSLAEAVQQEKAADQPYKLELLHDLEQEGAKITFYTNGDFTDLCRGGHVANTSEIPADSFKLTKVAGAYWRGDEKNIMMQRIYGVAFSTRDELLLYIQRLEEAKQRDHRKLGRELDLFLVSDLVGAGLPLFTPRGTVLREEFERYSNELRKRYGFEKVWTPHITKTALYEKSGHWAKFGNELFLVKSQETSDQFVMKPMNCPHHTRIYANIARSYRDLPIRYLETTTDYRDEKTGELGGLSRVRALTQDDSHVFCRPDQIKDEIYNLMKAVDELYQTVDMKLRVRLSYRDDSDAYLGDPKVWESAQKQLKDAVVAVGLEYFEVEGEAAFYGPKIDFMATDAIGREHQVATVQLDFVMPERFELEYSAENGVVARPVMIHCALLGSIERFLSVYIEHTAGKFPIWCAPEQLRIIKVKDDPKVDQFVAYVMDLAREHSVRVALDDGNNSVSKKIRNAEIWKVPYSVVIGDKEAGSGELPLRVRADLVADEAIEHVYKPEQLMKSIANESRGRVSKSSL